MKQLITASLLYALALTASLAQTLTLPSGGGTVATQEWVLQQLETLKNPGDAPPASSKPLCFDGPEPRSFTLRSGASYEVGYHANGMNEPVPPGIDWKILSSTGQVLHQGATGRLVTSQFLISLPAPLSPGQYTILLDGTGCTSSKPSKRTMGFTIAGGAPPGTETGRTDDARPPCQEGPTPVEVGRMSPTRYDVLYHGQALNDPNPPGIDWKILGGAGEVVASGSSGALTSNRFHAILPGELSPGTYTMLLNGSGCDNPDPNRKTLTFHVSGLEQGLAPKGYRDAPSSDRMIVLNQTGWGFEANDETGINPSWRTQLEKFQNLRGPDGQPFRALDVFRLNVRWYQYEAVEGQYADAAIVGAVKYLKSKGLKAAFCIWPYRLQEDGFVPESDWMLGNSGGLFTFEGRQYCPSVFSVTARQKYFRAMKHMAEVLAPYADDVVYMYTALGESEEYSSPTIQQQNPWKINEITGYEPASLEAWKGFLSSRGKRQQEAPRPDPGNMPWSTTELWKTEAGRLWYQHMTKGMGDFHRTFLQAVREGSGGQIKALGCFADAAYVQSAWYFTFNLKHIFEGSDIVFSTEGGGGSLWTKLLATDVIRGTFPNAIASMEFDPNDLTGGEGVDNKQVLYADLLKDYGGSFFRRGGKILHLSMWFWDGSDGSRNQLADIAPGLHWLRTEMINKTPPPIEIGAPVTVPLVNLDRDQFRYDWQRRGGGLNRAVPVVQDDSDFWK